MDYRKNNWPSLRQIRLSYLYNMSYPLNPFFFNPRNEIDIDVVKTCLVVTEVEVG